MTAGTPVETSTPNVNGQVITIAVDTAATADVVLTLPADVPKIDLSYENPVLQMFLLGIAADFAGSAVFNLDKFTKRGSATPDTATEWTILTHDTLQVFKSAATAGKMFITYITKGAKQT